MPDYATHDAAEQAILDRSVLRAGGTTITPSAAGVIGLITRAAVGQTANLQEWQNSAGTILSSIRSNGVAQLQYGKIGDSSAVFPNAGMFEVVSNYFTNVGAIVRGAASQTANLQEWQNSSGTILARVNQQGSFITAGDTAILRANNLSSFYAASASTKVLTIHGAASQSANLTEWQDSAGNILASVEWSGRFILNNPYSDRAKLVCRGTSTQSANLAEFQNSSGTVLDFIDANGRLKLQSDVPGSVRLQAQGAASQTANLAEFQNSSGTVLALIEAGGYFRAFISGPNALREFVAGAPDSAGAGFRTVRVAN